MMAQMIMKNRKQMVNTWKMFKWDICEKSMRYVPDIKGNGTYVEKLCNMSQKNREEGHISRKFMNMSRWRWQVGHSWKNISYMSNTQCKWDIINHLFSICPLSIWKVIEHLIFLKNICKSIYSKNGLENSIPKQSKRIKNILTFTNFTL